MTKDTRSSMLLAVWCNPGWTSLNFPRFLNADYHPDTAEIITHSTDYHDGIGQIDHNYTHNINIGAYIFFLNIQYLKPAAHVLFGEHNFSGVLHFRHHHLIIGLCITR